MVLVAGSSISAVQSLQLEHDDPSNLHMELIIPTLAVGNITKIAIFQGEDQSFCGHKFFEI